MKNIILLTGTRNNPRIQLGLERLEKALQAAGYKVTKDIFSGAPQTYREISGRKIFVGVRTVEELFQWLEQEEVLIYHTHAPKGEGFYLEHCPGELTAVVGGTDTGALYGCLELAERIANEGKLPLTLSFGDAPNFSLRGPALGLQKTKIEPPRRTYEYPITPERFPWFYDQDHWLQLLEMMLENRCNILYIWSGHPFSSLVKVKEYPEALEVSEEIFEKNREVFRWLTEECDRRGIWVVLKFYNIHIPLPFAEHHGLELRQNTILPIVSDYTAKSIVEFMKAFPHIGLMVCLGEALRGNENKTRWFTDTILPAVNQGIKEAGLTEAPPIILRGHDCDPYDAMTKGMEVYSNIYTMWKYNGEGLTTYYPRGNWQKTHRSLNGLGEAHIMNVHILANLEPFRYNAPSFIQKSVQAGEARLGCNGLHLYPLFYWDWPYSPDKTEPRLLQLERDWLWYKAWFRYAWKADRNEIDEKEYWVGELSKFFATSRKNAALLLEAMENIGECSPRILGRVGITEGNRQTSNLGMTMSQFTNVHRYRPNLELWNSVARRGEQPEEYVKTKLSGGSHIGETPLDMIADVSTYAEQAKMLFSAINPADIGRNKEEFLRIESDLEAMKLVVDSYCYKIKAALLILEYKLTMDSECLGDIQLLKDALEPWKHSMELYRELVALTEKTYFFANSMQTPQRRIPFPDGDAYGHWSQCLPEYEEELSNFKQHLLLLERGITPASREMNEDISALTPVPFTLYSNNAETYTIRKEESIFTDSPVIIKELGQELTGLTGVRFPREYAVNSGMTLDIEFPQDSLLLIGYMNADRDIQWLQVPDLETNTHADERGGLDPVYQNAMLIQGTPTVNIHAFRYEKGRHSIYFGTGGFVVVGVTAREQAIAPRNVALEGEVFSSLDWIYQPVEENGRK